MPVYEFEGSRKYELSELLDGTNVSPETYQVTRDNLEERLISLKETEHNGVDEQAIDSTLKVLELYVANRLGFIQNTFYHEVLRTVAQQYSIEHSDSFSDLSVKDQRKWTKPIINLMKQQEIGPAGISVIGYDDERHKGHKVNGQYLPQFIGESISGENTDLHAYIGKLLMGDGAFLINPEGEFVGGKTKLDNISAQGIHPDAENLADAIGLNPKASTRNYNSVAASYDLKGTLVLIMCQTKGDIKCFYDGKIIASTDPMEDANHYKPNQPKLVINQ